MNRLHDYGIRTEVSDIRAHVGVRAKTVYVFRTAEAKEIASDMTTDEGRFASQPGVAGPTAFGFRCEVEIERQEQGELNEHRRRVRDLLSEMDWAGGPEG